MKPWLKKVAAVAKAATAYHPVCETHGEPHQRITVASALGPMLVFDADRYRDTPGYCVGDDEVSRSFALYGTWEVRNARIFEDAVAEHPGIVLDIGCHVGWYSRIARWLNRDVIAFDAVTEHIEMCKANAPGVHAMQMWFDEHTGTLPVAGAPEIAAVKMDIEGAEQHALRMIEPLIDAGNVATILMEVSPVFNDSYPAVVRSLFERGYQAEVTVPFRQLTVDNLDAVLAEHPQFDVLFRRA